jgi:UDP-N-acetylglucosamine/UDP-N-acetylgalactosamine diphosphorylase
MSKQLLSKHFDSLDQKHLLYGLERLRKDQVEAFWQQAKRLDQALLLEQRKLLDKRSISSAEHMPLVTPGLLGSKNYKKIGCELVSQGKVGCIVLAGGHGSRLNWNGPKGTFPICIQTQKKSLFQRLCERIQKKQTLGQCLQIAIMTSLSNHRETESFFKKNHFFGLKSSQLHFFSQANLPLLDEEGNWCLEAPGKIAEGPNGNGDVLDSFFTSKIADVWQNLQIEYIHVIPIDNPLADPLDPELTGYTAESGLNVALKVVKKEFCSENMGVIVQKKEGISVIEYSEISKEDYKRFLFCNVNVFCFCLSALRNLHCHVKLPLHLARKKATIFLPNQTKQVSCLIWKYEKFLFDLLEHLPKSASLFYPRHLTYAPLKELGDLGNVEQALIAYERVEQKSIEMV